MSQQDDFRKYATRHMGISSMTLDRFTSQYNTSNSYISPTIIEERQLNVASMDVFSRLMMDRIIFLGAPIDDYVANIIQAQLLYLDSADPTKDIQVYFNTPGGGVHAGLGVYDTMQYIKPHVATICMGQTTSMAALLLASGAKGKRYALPHSRIMIHQPIGGAQGQATDIDIHAREILKIRENLNQILAYHTGQDIERIRKDTERDFFMSCEDAKAYGIIDKIIVKREVPKNSKDKK